MKVTSSQLDLVAVLVLAAVAFPALATIQDQPPRGARRAGGRAGGLHPAGRTGGGRGG
ncbi:MAG: hypothetical protein M5U12_20865 [Verrucomicrobia bacterium]|nr:hypothetical protein [Verrucomicrobiota bacterium]